MIYLAVFAFTLITIFSVSGKQKKSIVQKSFSEMIFGMSLLSIFAFAILVGINSKRADYINYLQTFRNSPIIGEPELLKYATSQHTEIAYNYFQALVKTLGGSATFFFVIFCLISLSVRYKFYTGFISKKDIGLVFLIFFAHEFLRKDCVQIRNGFASALVLASLVALYKGYKCRFVFIVFIASKFHTVALIALPLLFVKHERNKNYEKALLYILFLAFVVSIFFHVRILLSLFVGMNLLPSQIITYLNWSTYLTSMSLLNPLLLKQFTIMVWVLLKRKYLFQDSRIFFLSQVYLLSTVYYLVFRDFEILAARFGSLFYAVEAPLLVLAIEKSGKNIVLKKLALCFFYMALFLFNYFTYQEFLGWKPEFN